MEVEATPEVQSLIAKAFEASENNSTTTGLGGSEQYLVIPPDHVNEEVIVIDTTATDHAHRITRFKVADNKLYSKVDSERQIVEEQSADASMDCSTSGENDGGEEVDAASSIMAIQAASNTCSKSLTFEVIDSASQRGLPKLMDNFGYGYTLRRTSCVNAKAKGKCKGKRDQADRIQRRYWRCAVRGKQYSCGAGVVQEGDDCFMRNDQPHGHLPKPDGLNQVKIRKQIKMMAKQNMLDTGPAVVNTVLLENAEGDETECSRSIHANLVRTANRIREKMKNKVDISVENVLRNVLQYFEDEERAGTTRNINSPMKRLYEATGIPTRVLKKKLDFANDKDMAIKRCVGGEMESIKGRLEEAAEEALIEVVQEMESKNITFTTVNLRTALKLKHPDLNITQTLIGQILRKLGYETKNTKIWDVGIQKKSEQEKKSNPDVIKLVKGR
ncbi:uncharacterized protein LOC117330488 isoform X2 [Pecten maximus]|uniref:uncharacterized protein LOC117330488 isoform X2 n=1 Tax=Pecten maximus TaxID=6579 RepID=UPI0014589CBF|nr:uncharacterized protein LOC117330488 isoform X2 [Pecten maximus]